jgi:hypothetical protein
MAELPVDRVQTLARAARGEWTSLEIAWTATTIKRKPHPGAHRQTRTKLHVRPDLGDSAILIVAIGYVPM